ncbi:hypothetical protein H1R20_g7577, partial [Candolleomyces eurysporus]
MAGFGGSSSIASASASPMSAAHTVNTAALTSSGVNQPDDEDMQLGGWSFPPVPPPKPSRASLGLGLGPGVGVRTQTRSRSGSDANLLSTYSTSPGFRTPPGTSILSAVGTPSGGGRVVSEVEGGAGTRHAVYIVDSEEVSRRLGELLENRNSTLFSSAGHTAEEDDEDDLEDWESRRRTVVAVTIDADAGQEGEEERSAHPERIMEEVQEQQRRPQADPVLPLGDLFAPRRPAPLVHSASMPVVPQYNTSPPASVADSRPVTPPPSLGHRPSYSVGTMINVTPTRKAPYPPSSQMHTPRRQWNVADAAPADGGSPVMGVTTPPPIHLPPPMNEQGCLGSTGAQRECGAFEGGVEFEGSLKVSVQVVVVVVEPLEVVVQGSFEVVVEGAFEIAVQGVGVSSPAGSSVVAAAAFAAVVPGCCASVGCCADFDQGGFGEEVGAAAEEAASGSSAGLGVGSGDESGASRLSRRSMVERSEEEGYGYGSGSAYHEREESGEMEHDEEIEALRREMGFDQHLDGRRHHHHQQHFEDNDEEMGFRSSRRTSEYLGEGEDTLRAHRDRPALHVHVRSSKRWSVDSVVLKDLPPQAIPTSPPLPPIPQSAPAVHDDHQRRHQRHQAVEEPPKIERSMSYFDDDYSDNEDDLEDPDLMPMMGMAMMGKKNSNGSNGASGSGVVNGNESVRSRMGWGRRSRDEKKDEKEKDKSKSAPSSPVITRKSREEKRKSFGRGDGNVGGGEEGSGQGKSRGRLASFFSKLAGSGSAASSASPSTTTSSPSAYSPAGAHERKIMTNASEPDLRSTNGAWEALPSERVPPVPPVPPLHTLPRMESRTSLKSFGSQGKSKSRRATMISQQWDDEDYGNVISGGTGVGNSVPPTPSSLASGFSLTAGTSPRESRASSIIGGIGPNGLSPNLRTSRSVSNLNLLVNRGGIQELGAGTSGWMVSPPATPGMEHGFNVSEHAFATSYSPQQQLPGMGDVLRKSDDSGSSLPPPPVPPKDFAQGGKHEWPPSPSLPSIPGSAASTNGLFPPGISVPNGNGNGAVMNPDKARDRMMVRLRLKSSPSLGSLRTQQQQSQGGKKLRNFAARMMGKEEFA